MLDYLRSQGLAFMDTPSQFPHYLPYLDGALARAGRALNPALFDAQCLGDSHLKYLPGPYQRPFAHTFEDIGPLTRPGSLDAQARTFPSTPESMVKPMVMGSSLVAQLLKICKDHGVEIWTGCELQDLLCENGRVVGASVKQRSSAEAGFFNGRIHAARGVLLATAGFSKNQQLRDRYLRKPTSMAWSLTTDADTGISLQVGEKVCADVGLLGEFWGIPTMYDPKTGGLTEAFYAITRPYSIVVDSFSGRRFFPESQCYADSAKCIHTKAAEHVTEEATAPAPAHSWLVFDQSYRSKYLIGSLAPSDDIKNAVENGLVLTSDSIAGLQAQMNLRDGRNGGDELQETVNNWNEMCASGTDKDYQRGADVYQQFLGDPDVQPNPCMGAIQRAPFYALRVYPGDAGSKGGLRNDEHARVLRKDGSAIPGLYVAGNASAATVFGSKGPAAGVTIGPAMTYGFIAARHMESNEGC